jgi:hypothetical protein
MSDPRRNGGHRSSGIGQDVSPGGHRSSGIGQDVSPVRSRFYRVCLRVGA